MIIKNKNLNLQQISNSGQCFRWKEIGLDCFKVPINNKYVICTQIEPNVILVQEKDIPISDIYNYFDLGTDYQMIIEKIPIDDKYLQAAAAKFSGIRILKQDLWEMVASFVISQNNNISRIQKSIETLCGNTEKFPDPEKLKSIDISACKFGYRERYVAELANSWSGRDLEDFLNNTGYSRSKQHLMTYCGIGSKVADCICLFGLHHLEACPIDTWMKKIINKHYNGIKPEWMNSSYAGVYQQYVFEYERSLISKGV